MTAKLHVIHHDYHATHSSGLRPIKALRFIVLHDMENTAYNSAAENTGAWFENRASGGSSNYGVDNNSIQQYLDLGVTPWGAPSVNYDGVHIEQMGRADWNYTQWLAKAAGTLDNTAWLMARLNTITGIPLRRLTDNQVSHRVKGVITHLQATRVFGGTHTDPGSGYPLDHIINMALRYAKQGV